jgi:hypothetical protein
LTTTTIYTQESEICLHNLCIKTQSWVKIIFSKPKIVDKQLLHNHI